MTVDDNSSANVFHSHNSNHNNNENGDQVGENGDDDDNIVVVVEHEQASPGLKGDADHYHGNGHPHHSQNHHGLSTTTTSTTTTPTVNPILSCSSSSSKSAVPTPFPYTRIHAHCGHCIRPLRCIRKPAFAAAGATSASPGLLSTEELYAMILSVNFYNSGGLLPTETDQLDSCPVVRCPNDVCPVLLHYCKLPEHFLLCHYQKVKRRSASICSVYSF